MSAVGVDCWQARRPLQPLTRSPYGEQVRFPERVLAFKVESGSSEERDKWADALERAAAQRPGSGGAPNSKLEQLKKVTLDAVSCTCIPFACCSQWRAVGRCWHLDW